MKRLLIATLPVLFAFTGVIAQSIPLPPALRVPHYQLRVTYNSTTVLVFGASVRPVDRGNRDILAQRQPGADNVLKIKAARINFPPTNLHVFTADGRLFAFDVCYSDSLAATYDLTRLNMSSVAMSPAIQLPDDPLNSARLDSALNVIRTGPKAFSITRRRYQMRFRLENIDLAGPLLFFRFSVANHSTLEYTPDFVRLYISDEARAKRTSRQDLEIATVYQDGLPPIPGGEIRRFVLAIPKTTIPDRKEFRIELYEKNGGRSVSLRIRNRDLFRATPLLDKPL